MSIFTFTRQKFPNGFFHPVVWCITAQLKWRDHQPREKSQRAASCGSVTVQWLEWAIFNIILFYFAKGIIHLHICVYRWIYIYLRICICTYIFTFGQRFRKSFREIFIGVLFLMLLSCDFSTRQWWPLQALARPTSLLSWVASLLSSC